MQNIRIYPEWNVKVILAALNAGNGLIRIYPEWNVKLIFDDGDAPIGLIRIYPEWNVKRSSEITEEVRKSN